MNVAEKNALIHRCWWLLKLTYGLAAIVVGADKFFNYIVDWSQYVSPMIASRLPATITMTQFCYVIGVIEIIVGLLILTKFTRIGAYIMVGWLLVIVINLLSMGKFYDIAARDVVMAAGALVLAWLTEWCEC